MANQTKARLLQELTHRYGPLRKLDRSQSLYEVPEGRVRIYIRYSKLHAGHRTFYGLREEDLRALEGHRSLICFLWDGQGDPLFVPYSDYEEVFHSTFPAGDGQYKAQVLLNPEGSELYVARAGRFNVDLE